MTPSASSLPPFFQRAACVPLMSITMSREPFAVLAVTIARRSTSVIGPNAVKDTSNVRESALSSFVSERTLTSYGAPYDVKVLSDTKDESADSRTLEVSFTALGPMTEVDRRAIVTAKTAKGSRDIVMLISGTQAARWKKGGKEDALGVTSSFRVATRPTDLKAVPSTDYRYGRTSGPSNMKSRNDGF